MEGLYIKKTKKGLNNNIYEIIYELKYDDILIATTRCRFIMDTWPDETKLSELDAEADERSREILLEGVEVIE